MISFLKMGLLEVQIKALFVFELVVDQIAVLGDLNFVQLAVEFHVGLVDDPAVLGTAFELGNGSAVADAVLLARLRPKPAAIVPLANSSL